MSHLYNPYPTDQQSSQAQSDSQRTSHPDYGSSYWSGPSVLSPNISSLLALPLPAFIAAQSRLDKEEEPKRSADVYSDRAWEESQLSPRSYAITPPSQGHRKAVAESSDRSLNLLPTYISTIDNDASKYYTSAASSIFSGGGESWFTTIDERKPHEQSIPGLGENEFAVQETPSAQPEFSRPKYTPELASKILLHFGLEKEDLEQLILYPEDQITPQNLPFILCQIRQQKTNNLVSAVKAAAYPEPKPITSLSDTNFRGHMGEMFHQDYRPRGILKTSKVIDYGHMSQFSAGPGEEVGMTRGVHSVGNSTLLMYSSSREAKEMSISSLISHCDQESSVPGLDFQFSSKLSSKSVPTSHLPKQFSPPSKQFLQTVSVPFTKTDTGSRILPGSSKSLSLKGPDPSQLKSSKPRISDTPSPSVASGWLGLMLYDSLKDPRRSLKQVSKFSEQKLLLLQQSVKQEVKRQQSAAQRSPTSRVDTASGVPAPAQMYDYVATTTGMYPHSCSLCNKECFSVKEWINHQNTELHLRNCKLLRTRFPEWDGELLTSLSASDEDARSSSTRTSQSRKKRRNSSSRSRSQSYSPQRHRSYGSRRDQARSRYRSRSRSNSPSQSSRRTRRSRSRSQSPLYRSTTSRYRSRSRSYERRSSPRRRDDRRSSAKRSRSRERRSLEKLSAWQMPSDSAEALAQKLLGSSAIQALSNQSDLEAVVKTLAPALLAELTKMKTSPSSTSSCSVSKKDPKTKTQPVSADDAASTVRLLGVLNSISHSHLEGVARLFGKATSITIFRKLKEAQVVFEKPEDAEKMRSAESHKLMGMRVKSSGGASSGSQTPAQERKKAPPTKNEKSRMSSSLSKAQNVPESGKHYRAAGFTTPSSLSKAQNVRSKPAKVLESGKQKQAADSTTQSSAANPSNTAAAKKPTGQPIKPTVVNKPSQPAKGSTSGPKAPAADKKDSTSSEKKTEKKDKEAAVKVEKPPDKTKKLVGPPITSNLEVLVKQESQEDDEEKLSEVDVDRTSKIGVLPLTGEMLGKNLLMKRIACVEMKSIFSPEFASKNRRVLRITNLPKYENGNYTERDVVNLLTPFGFQHEDEHLHNIYVIPQKRMALAVLPTAEMAINVIRPSVMNCLKLSGCKLLVKILEDNFSTPMEFYQSLMMWMNEKIHLHQEKRIIFIKNISPSEARNLREVLKKIDNVKNYAPLLNKVFIEFHMIHDADRLGVWYSLLNEPPQHSVYRLGTLRSTMTSPLPKMAEKAIPDLSLRLKFTDVPMNSGIPLECGPPFYVTMTTFPFIFPTSCPWFNIPPCHNPSTVSSTIMMTCLPEDGYCQLDVARMVWNLLHQRNIISMFYRVMVLPLQRRAFIYFNNPESGREFSRRHSIKPFCIKDKPVKIYVVDHNMNPEFTEEEVYRQLMKWSNARLTEKSRLEHRLLLVLVSEVSLELIQAVMKEVSSVGRLAAFLPLGNRICIEMLEPSDWMKVMEAKLGSLTAPHIWKKVIRVDTVQSLRQHQLQSLDVTINLEEDPQWAAPDQTAQDSNSSSSSSTKPAAANMAPVSGSAPETSKDVEMIGQGSSGAVEADSNVANSDDMTRTKKLPEVHKPSKKRLVVLTVSKHRPVLPTPSIEHLEGPASSEQCPEGQKLSKECPEDPTPSKECPEGVKAAVEPPKGLSAGLKPSKECPEGQTTSEKWLEVPTPSEEHPEGSKPSKECSDGLAPSEEKFEGPASSEKQPKCLTQPKERPLRLTPSDELSQDLTPIQELPQGPTSSEELPHGPTSSMVQSERSTQSEECPEGLNTSKQPKTETEECPPLGEDKIKAILAAIQQHKQAKEGKVSMGFTEDIRPSEGGNLHFKQDTDKFVTLDEVRNDTKDTAKNTLSSNSSNKSDRASEQSRSPSVSQTRKRVSCTASARDKSGSPERRSHRDMNESQSPNCRSHSDMNKSQSPNCRSHSDMNKSQSPNCRSHSDMNKSRSSEHRFLHSKDKSISPDRRAHQGWDKLLTTKRRSPSNKRKEKSSCTERSSQPGEEQSSGTKSKERSLNTKSRSKQEKSSNSSLSALSVVVLMMSAENSAAEPKKETPVEEPKEEETLVTQSPKSEGKQEEEMENYQIFDLFKDNIEAEYQLPGPEEDQSLDGLSFQVFDSIDDEGMAEQEESDEPQTDTSSQALDSVTEDQSATDHVTEVAVAENATNKTKVSNTAKRPRWGRGKKRGRKPKVLAENKDTTDQENVEVLDSVKNPTETEDHEPRSRAFKDVTPEDELELTKQEEVYQVIDLVAEQSVPNTKKKQVNRGIPTRRSARGRTSEGESEEKQDETQTKSEATKPDSITNKEGADDVPCMVLDTVGSETIQETEKVGRRSTRRNKEEKITSQTANNKEEPKYQVIDSMNNGTPEEDVTMTRSTGGRRGRSAKRDIPTRGQTAPRKCEEGKETSPKVEETAVTAEEVDYKVIDSVKAPPVSGQKGKRGRTRNVKATNQPAAPKKAKVETEEESTHPIIDSVEEEAAEDQESSNEPGTAEESSTTEDNHDKQKITKSVSEEDKEKPSYQIVDSVEDDQGQEEAEDDQVPDNMIPFTIKGSTEGAEEQKDYTNLTEDKNRESSTWGSAHLILDKQAKELEINNEEPGRQSSCIKKYRSEKMEITAFEAKELLNLDEERADEAPEEGEADGSEKEEEGNQEEPRSRICKYQRRKHMEMNKMDFQVLLTLDKVGADDALDKRESDCSKQKEALKQEADMCSRSSSREGLRRNEVEKDEVDTLELLTLDEVGVDDAPEQPEAEDPEPKEELSIHDKGKDRPDIESGQSLDRFKSETLVAVDEEKDDDHRHNNDITVVGKRRKEPMEPEAKRSRCQSPDVPVDFSLPTYHPGNPLGQEFVVPKAGFFCNICSIIYANENRAKEVHCSSRRHYNNLKKYYLKLKTTPSRASSPTSSNISSDGM